jgi:hypothetical protein
MTMRFRTIQLLLAGASIAAIPAAAQNAGSGPLSFSATTDNVGAKDSIRIDLLRFSTEAERDDLVAAWNMTGAKKGPAAKTAAAPTAPAAPLTEEQLALCRKVDRGVTGSARRAELPAFCPSPLGAPGVSRTAKLTPESSLMAAMKTAPFLGYLWVSGEVAGYGVRYAARMPEQDGGEHIILVTDRRLGAWNDSWKPAAADEGSDYGFSVIELHLNAKGEGEGKSSLTGKVALDSAARILTLENYSASPVILRKVKREAN